MSWENKEKKSGINTATWITISRLAMIPIILFFYIAASADIIDSVFFIRYGRLVALILFVVAAATDWLDGFIARRYNQITDMGKLLDPIADKVLTMLGFLLILTDSALIADAALPLWFGILVVFIALARDIIINAFRMFAVQRGVTIAADKFGKIKTMLQFAAITLYMLYAFNHWPENTFIDYGVGRDIFKWLCILLMSAATLLTVYSCVNYILKFRNAGKTPPAIQDDNAKETIQLNNTKEKKNGTEKNRRSK